MNQHNITTILYEPQQNVNIGATVRVLLNLGFERLRLIRPAAFDPMRIDAIAHRSAALVERIEHFEELTPALVDQHTIVGFSARQRGERHTRPWLDIAPSIRALAEYHPVAFMFGREDFGLPNAALEHCTHVCSLPVTSTYPSLNLADAVLLALYELQRTPPAPLPEPPPSQAAYNELLTLLDQALEAAQFSRTSGQHIATLRTLRDLVLRAAPTQPELALLQALCRRALGGPRKSK